MALYSTTIFKDINDAIPIYTASDLSLEIKYGADDFRWNTFTYDHISKSVKVYTSPSNQSVYPYPPIRYPDQDAGINSWFPNRNIGHNLLRTSHAQSLSFAKQLSCSLPSTPEAPEIAQNQDGLAQCLEARSNHDSLLAST